MLESVSVYPSIGVLTIKSKGKGQPKEHWAFMLWSVARELDPTGSGWIKQETLKKTCLEFLSPSIYKAAIKTAVESTFITPVIHKDNPTPSYHITSVVKVALRYGLSHVGHYRILIPVARLKKASSWKASLWSAYHASRGPRSSPISRQTLTTLTGIPSRTQRYYERKTRVKARTNYLITGDNKLPKEMGAIVRDNRERGGYFSAGGNLIEQLPNSYSSPLKRRSNKPDCRKTNRRLKVLLKRRDGELQKTYCRNRKEVQAVLKAMRYDKPGTPSGLQPNHRVLKNSHKLTGSGANIFFQIV